MQSEFAPSLHRLRERHLVRVFEIAADGQAVRDARDPDAEGLDEAREYVDELTDRALEVLDRVFAGREDAMFLKELTSFLAGRSN